MSRYFVDARVLSIFEGADETLCLRVIARRLAEQALDAARAVGPATSSPPRASGGCGPAHRARAVLERRVRPGPAVTRRRARPSGGRGTTATPTRGAPACRAAGSCARCAARRPRCWPSTRAPRSRPAHAARRQPGGTFSVPPTARGRSRRRARRARRQRVRLRRAGSLPRLLAARPPADSAQGREFWSGFPQRECGEADPRVCFSVDHFMEEVFLRSDTSMVVLSALPIAPEGSPMSTPRRWTTPAG